jgi:hypothetical protein
VEGTEVTELKKISRKDVEGWYGSAINSGFGNVVAQETQHDINV